MRSGPSVTIVRTTASSHRPAPASSVSRTCNSNESSSLVTQAIPPCAQAVFVSEPLRFVITATDPCFAAFNAKLRPAIPLPITTKSYSFIPTGYCRLGESCRRTRQARAMNLVSPFQGVAKFPNHQPPRNQSAPAALHRLLCLQDRQFLSQICCRHLPLPTKPFAKLVPASVLRYSNTDCANCMPDRLLRAP